jgi:hypothetical protein
MPRIPEILAERFMLIDRITGRGDITEHVALREAPAVGVRFAICGVALWTTQDAAGNIPCRSCDRFLAYYVRRAQRELDEGIARLLTSTKEF